MASNLVHYAFDSEKTNGLINKEFISFYSDYKLRIATLVQRGSSFQNPPTMSNAQDSTMSKLSSSTLVPKTAEAIVHDHFPPERYRTLALFLGGHRGLALAMSNPRGLSAKQYARICVAFANPEIDMKDEYRFLVGEMKELGVGAARREEWVDGTCPQYPKMVSFIDNYNKRNRAKPNFKPITLPVLPKARWTELHKKEREIRISR